MGGIDPFGDIMGTSAGPGREERIYLYRAGSHLHSSVSSTHAGGDANEATHRAAGTPGLKSLFHFLQTKLRDYNSCLRLTVSSPAQRRTHKKKE